VSARAPSPGAGRRRTDPRRRAARQARRDRAARADAGDAEAGRRALRQRAHGDHAPASSALASVGGGLAFEREVAREVVLDHERARLRGGREHGRVAVGREDRARRVRVPGLEVDEPRARRRERLGEELRANAAVVGRHGHEPHAGRARRRDRAEVGRRLDQHRRAGRRERADDRRNGRLPARRDEHVVRAGAAAGFARTTCGALDAFDGT
jgi:hypothetical protein